jgi:amino acid transporter
MLTAPRVYFAMAQDGVFFRSVAWISPRTAAPSVAIALQGVVAMIIAVSGRYEQILNYVTSVDFILFGFTGIALLVFRARQPRSEGFRTPGHPVTTIFLSPRVSWWWVARFTNIPRIPRSASRSCSPVCQSIFFGGINELELDLHAVGEAAFAIHVQSRH